ncbi:MAG: hypothetical protein HUU11_02520 [Anaerolineales bacterium]|nr:hypothetical protein [Anaerolineales bacterium]NUQ83563.1 hypothetical protein [Anaerolineales bacterium]
MTRIFSMKRYILKALVITLLVCVTISAAPPVQTMPPEDLIRDDMMLIAYRYATHLWTASDVGPPPNIDGNIRHGSGNIETPETMRNFSC